MSSVAVQPSKASNFLNTGIAKSEKIANKIKKRLDEEGNTPLTSAVDS
jgi:hypothetical protein